MAGKLVSWEIILSLLSRAWLDSVRAWDHYVCSISDRSQQTEQTVSKRWTTLPGRFVFELNLLTTLTVWGLLMVRFTGVPCILNVRFFCDQKIPNVSLPVGFKASWKPRLPSRIRKSISCCWWPKANVTNWANVIQAKAILCQREAKMETTWRNGKKS